MVMSKLSLRNTLGVIAVSCLFLSGIAGCFPDRESQDSVRETNAQSAPAPVSSVPLRILSMLAEETNAKLATAWNATSEQPIEIRAVTASELLTNSRSTDVVIAEALLMGDLQDLEALTPFPDAVAQAAPFSRDTLLEGLLQQDSAWGNQLYGFPLVASLPCLWLGNDSVQPPTTWSDYQTLINALPVGRSAEPLASGFAVDTYLNRASMLTGSEWLFDPQDMAPVLETPPYVRALVELVEARKQYPSELLSPTQIWELLSAGSLDIAIASPPVSLTEAQLQAGISFRMSQTPRSDEVYMSDWRPASDFTPPSSLGSSAYFLGVSSGCRQTSVARAFINWMASGEGYYEFRRAVGGLAVARQYSAEAAEMERIGQTIVLEGGVAEYRTWFSDMMQRSALRPSMRLRGSEQYRSALDAAVIRAVQGEQTPEEALSQASQQWQAITTKLGIKTQLNSWRQSQGLRER